MPLTPERILILKPSSLGDIVHALPTLASLRQRFPQAYISWLVKEEWSELLDGNPDLDEVFPVTFSLKAWPSIVRRVREKRFDVVIDLQGLLRTGILARLSGASQRVGFAGAREGSAWFYTQRVALPIKVVDRPWRLVDMHAVDRNLEVARFFGADISRPMFCIPDVEDDRRVIEEYLDKAGVQGNDQLIVMAPASREEIKNWPIERFADVAEKLCQESNRKIVLLGSPSQAKMMKAFSFLPPENCLNLVGKLRLRQIGSLLRRAHVLIANDSAPVHLAMAIGVPVLGLYGPTHIEATGPYGTGSHRVLHTEMPCRPCGKKVCHHVHEKECLLEISVEEVVQAARQLLSNRRMTVSEKSIDRVGP